MQCVSPIWITETSDTQGTYVPCGRCYNCIQTKRSVWTFRILQELKASESAYFITLTYKEEKLPFINGIHTLVKSDLTKFIKRLRAHILTSNDTDTQYLKKSEITQKWSPKLRYFACGEYGSETKRPHYHIIAYNIPHDYIKEDPIHKNQYSPRIESIWQQGQIQIAKVERGSAHYMTKHHMFPLDARWNKLEGRQKPFAVMSRKPGIGANYADNEQIQNYYYRSKNSFATLKDGIKTPLGRYLKSKIYKEDQTLKEVQQRTKQYAEEQEQRNRNQYSNEGAYLKSKRDQAKEGLKKFTRNLNKNDKL